MHECGQPIVEAFDAASEDAYQATAIRCWACSEAASFAKAYDGNADGLAITVTKGGSP